jgi:hypothetical protein
MELKRRIADWRFAPWRSFNRTSMELKPSWRLDIVEPDDSFNRTSMELKLLWPW